MRPVIIGVAGGSGSGKTTVVREIVKALGPDDVTVIQHDSYYRDRSGMTAAERAAVNTPIQGTAADLMKLAMIAVDRALKARMPSARLLLQVHDELLLEAPAAEAQTVAALTRAEMQRCLTLAVPLEVSVGLGPTWLDVH